MLFLDMRNATQTPPGPVARMRRMPPPPNYTADMKKLPPTSAGQQPPSYPGSATPAASGSSRGSVASQMTRKEPVFPPGCIEARQANPTRRRTIFSKDLGTGDLQHFSTCWGLCASTCDRECFSHLVSVRYHDTVW